MPSGNIKYKNWGANLISALFFTKFLRVMEENDNNKNEIPSKMARLAWPKSKYGLYIALFIIILVLLILYKDLIL